MYSYYYIYTDNKLNTYFVDTRGVLYLFDDEKMTSTCNDRYKTSIGRQFLRCKTTGGSELASEVKVAKSNEDVNTTRTSEKTRTNESNTGSDTSINSILAYVVMFLLVPFAIIGIGYYYFNRNSNLKSNNLNKTVKKITTDNFTENFNISTDENKYVITNL